MLTMPVVVKETIFEENLATIKDRLAQDLTQLPSQCAQIKNQIITEVLSKIKKERGELEFEVSKECETIQAQARIRAKDILESTSQLEKLGLLELEKVLKIRK